ncbi:CLUMA_CG008760, isoform A [Clunio marinus]|uniref:CLUMA_CG008760, isoform A n=1 Tax=Clunio marinus TaxID=568069 RepID=A0A1J1I8Z8_9DIPT|nr:CLUMA_CG008760, isoform A [Clunio marinus]
MSKDNKFPGGKIFAELINFTSYVEKKRLMRVKSKRRTSKSKVKMTKKLECYVKLTENTKHRRAESRKLDDKFLRFRLCFKALEPCEGLKKAFGIIFHNFVLEENPQLYQSADAILNISLLSSLLRHCYTFILKTHIRTN